MRNMCGPIAPMVDIPVNAKVTPEWFSDERYQRIYAYCLKHWRMHGVAPDEAVIKRSYPSYPWAPYSQPIGYYIDELRKRRRRSLIISGVNDVAGFMQSEDPDATEQMFMAVFDDLRKRRIIREHHASFSGRN